jgi:hypothetical protein
MKGKYRGALHAPQGAHAFRSTQNHYGSLKSHIQLVLVFRQSEIIIYRLHRKFAKLVLLQNNYQQVEGGHEKDNPWVDAGCGIAQHLLILFSKP